LSFGCGSRAGGVDVPVAMHVENQPPGRIRGVVKLIGEAPPVRLEATNKNTEICGPSVPVTRLAVGSQNGVKQAFVYLDGVQSADEVKPAASLTIEQKGCEY